MNKKRGFTLIELLAVMIILGVLALITTPIVMGLIENSKKKSFELSVKGIYDAIMQDKTATGLVRNLVYEYQDNSLERVKEKGKPLTTPVSVSLDGKIQQGQGYAIVNKDGTILINIQNGKWCGYTEVGDTSIKIKDGDCPPYEPGDEPNICYSFDENTGTILKYNPDKLTECSGDVVIPQKINGVPVKVLAPGSFVDASIQMCMRGREWGPIEVPLDYIHTADDGYQFCAFAGLDTSFEITSVDFSNAIYLEKIGYFAFIGADAAGSMEIPRPASVKLTELIIKDLPNLRVIEDAAFMGVTLENITLENLPALETIGIESMESVANNFNSLTLRNLPSLSQIGNMAFLTEAKQQLTIVDVPNATQIKGWTFCEIPDMANITLENVSAEIGDAVNYCLKE